MVGESSGSKFDSNGVYYGHRPGSRVTGGDVIYYDIGRGPVSQWAGVTLAFNYP